MDIYILKFILPVINIPLSGTKYSMPLLWIMTELQSLRS